ncbi:hypothetical protein MJD09_20375 [bacterium]|nr:hypothetical protein [bacterium]
MKPHIPSLRFQLVLLTSIIFSGVMLLPLCDAIYKCGCTFPWSGAADYCNVRKAGVPHCPWCERRHPVLMALPFLAIFAGQSFAIHLVRKRSGDSVLKMGAAGLVTFLVLSLLNGYLFKWIDGYPRFVF